MDGEILQEALAGALSKVISTLRSSNSQSSGGRRVPGHRPSNEGSSSYSGPGRVAAAPSRSD